MKQDGIRFPEPLTEAVAERGRLWQEYDVAVQNAGQVKALSQKVSASGSIETIPLLTTAATPSDEVARCVVELQKEFNNIGQAESQITAYQEEIVRIRNRAQQMYVGIGIALVIFLYFVFTALF
ncbi:MAG: hypothetical protein H0T73_04370 [Ardenticatenales bacterium]|nr:hypothetical protein [Ardenticatenales bacterium]